MKGVSPDPIARALSLTSHAGDRIRQRRQDLGLTQRELADRLGCSHVGVCQTETATRGITVERLARYAAALDTEAWALLHGWDA